MPSNPLTPAVENLPRGILLLEEYSALGVAISSALRKFAPLHKIQVAHGFAEAEEAARAMRPELFVLDVDPLPTGEIEFLNRLKIQYPDSRVLVIAAGSARQLRVERGTDGALQFIGKPFDLGEFGAAVQALLGPWATHSTARIRGTLRDLHLLDILQLKCLAGCTAAIRVETVGDKSGEIHFRKGQICHAATGEKVGLMALEEIVCWPGARLTETELRIPVPSSIEQAWDAVLVLLVRKLRRLTRKNPPPALSKPPPVKDGKKILVIDDTEMLLIFVADILATADQNFQITTAATGSEGIQLARRGRPDLVLLDYSLTDMTGDRVCRALIEDPATATIPILMMSGHLSELTKTAAEYGNVVAALPKPFLSGALINAVERVFAGSPRKPGAPPKPAPTAPPAPPTMAPPQEEKSAAPLTDGHGASAPPGSVPAMVAAPSVVEAPPAAVEPITISTPSQATPEVAPVAAEPERPPPPSPNPPPTPTPQTRSGGPMIVAPPPAAGVTPTELSVTLVLKVVALQFTSSLQMETATLQPFDRIVSVKMGEAKELSGVPLESGFRLGKIVLGARGQIETMRLVPTRQPPQLPVPSNLFAVGSSNFLHANADSKLNLSAPAAATMRVRMTTQFELVSVELSVGFEVAAVLLKANASTVRIRNETESAGRSFKLEGIMLDQSAEVESLSVRTA